MDPSAYLRFPLALVFVLALLALAVWALRRLGWPAAGATRDGRRLEIVEALPLDPKRRLVLIRRDRVEHLVLIGPEHAVVLETAIAASAPPEPRAIEPS